MLKSMTGFGRCEMVTQLYKITVEMKSVNHRYCDISIKMPKKLNFFEAGVRNVLKEYIGRGKVDVYINFEDYTENQISVRYNKDIAQGYFNGICQIAEDFKLKNDISIEALSHYPDVLVLESQNVDEDALFAIVEKAIRSASEQFVTARIHEGTNLKQDIMDKLQLLEEYVGFIDLRFPRILQEYREKLFMKVQELLGGTNIDEGVLATELAVYADKICIDEETVRLKSHIVNMKNTLEDSMSIGRKLDFIAQEMHREANTILSKASDMETSNKAIDLKTEIEKIREQIQNIE